MEVQIKKAVKAGNSSAVILPRAWLNKEIRVELVRKTSETILSDALDIAKKYADLKDIIGIYLIGSYARGEEDENSDIDVLVITDNIDKEMINEGIYNILIISSELLKQKLSYDLFPIGPMIKEAKPLINSNYLSSIKVEVTKGNIKWYLDTTNDKLKIIKKVIGRVKADGQYLSDKIAYTLVLRIRTLLMIKNIIQNKTYSKKEFIKLINRISKGENAYEGYLSVKNNLAEKKRISVEECKMLYNYLDNQLTGIREMLRY
ncbi:MAG: nucleotidyltransferase domain-containing protein [Nanoarchaeota archaeon]|nr:nucleotidyltransferase domain-containing protein [Nanoarchaeota archaeon]